MAEEQVAYGNKSILNFMYMQPTGEKFHISFRGKPAEVEVLKHDRVLVYRASLPDAQPLFLSKAKDASGSDFWTSIPEGRLLTATEVGMAIDEYLEQKGENKKTIQPSLF
jgi:hypothetical protein